MAAKDLKPFQCIGLDNGKAPLMGNAPLASGETPNFGDVIYKVSGEVTEAGADPASIAGVMAHEYNETYGGTFSGADNLLQSVANIDMLYFRADPANRFVGCLNTALALTDEGTAYGIVTSSGTWVIDGNDTTNTRVTVLHIFNDDINGVIGDTNARVIFKFNSANYQE